MSAAKSAERNLTTLRRRRGVVKRSLARIVNQLRDLEANPEDSSQNDQIKQLLGKLEGLDKEFRASHLDVMDLIEEDSPDQEKEDEILDKHEDDVAATTLRLQTLLKSTSPPSSTDVTRPLSRKLSRVERCLEEADRSLSLLDASHDEVPLLKQHQERLADMMKELSTLYEELIVLDLPDDHVLARKHTAMEALQFKCAHCVKKLLNAHSSKSTVSSSENSSKLPKLNVPTFDGEVLHWQQFWEQFEVAVHNRSSLSDAEKLVYLKQGSARSAIEGLSQSGDQYKEAIDCLKSRYSRPRLIPRAHVRTIMDTPPLKEGSGKELRRLHDVLLQHLRALKTMNEEPDPSFVTSIIELKLDTTTSFEWQKHSQGTTTVPHYQDILDFLDLRAQASEVLAAPSRKQGVSPHGTRPAQPGRVTSYAAANDSSRNRCVLCPERHPLYACPKFRAMSHDDMTSILKQYRLCVNCLSAGHFVSHCKSSHRCLKCQRRHHTLLHVERDDGNQAALNRQSSEEPAPSQVVSNAAVKLRSSSLLMTCRVLVFAADGSSVEARALLDNGSTSSFVSERLVQNLVANRMCVSLVLLDL